MRNTGQHEIEPCFVVDCMAIQTKEWPSQYFTTPNLCSPSIIVCMAIAANKIPTKRDITVEIVKLNNRDAHEAEQNIAPEIIITKATAKTFSNASSNSSGNLAKGESFSF